MEKTERSSHWLKEKLSDAFESVTANPIPVMAAVYLGLTVWMAGTYVGDEKFSFQNIIEVLAHSQEDGDLPRSQDQRSQDYYHPHFFR